MKKSRKKGLFWKIFAVSLAVWCVICGVLLIIGNDVMKDYDNAASSVLQKATELADKINAGEYDILYDIDPLPATLVFESDTFEQNIKDKIATEGACTATKGFSTDRYEKPVYYLMIGDTKIAEVEFKKSEEKSKYGFDLFEIAKILPNTDANYEIRVLVPTGGVLTINDIEVPESYLEETTEAGKIYLVEGLVSEGNVKVTYTDTQTVAKLRFDSKNNYWCVKEKSLTIVAPSNFEVFVGEYCISEANYSAEDVQFTVVSESNSEIESLVETKKYKDCDIAEVTYLVENVEYLGDVEIYAIGLNETKILPTYDEKEDVYNFPLGTATTAEALGLTNEWLFQRAIDYAKFVNNDGERSEILKYVKSDTVYSDFDNFWATLSAHDRFEILNEKIDTLEQYTDEIFLAKVEFDYTIYGYNHRHDNEKNYHTVVAFWYGKFDGSWKIIDYSLAQEE